MSSVMPEAPTRVSSCRYKLSRHTKGTIIWSKMLGTSNFFPTLSRWPANSKFAQCVVGFLILGLVSVSAGSTDLGVFNHNQSVDPVPLQIAGKVVNAWQASSPGQSLTLEPTQPVTVPLSGTIFLQVTYLDRGYGRLTVQCQGALGHIAYPDKYTRIVLEDSGNWVIANLRFLGLPAGVSPIVQISLEKNKDNCLIISHAALADTPFTDAHFQYILADAWNRPYDGPTTPGIDNKTLKGKIMVGYQGWFRTPNDPTDRGWVHWGDIAHGHFTTDMWPDISAYPPEALDKAADVKTLSGRTGYLFSSAWPEVVRTHFAWMRQNNIDGAFAQRFLSDTYSVSGRSEWVLSNVRAAANQEGRIWAVEYDVSGTSDARVLEVLKKDWIWLVDHFGLKTDPSYAHENGKLVVFIWGLPVPDRQFTPDTANAVVDFFKSDPVYGGNYVIGGIPAGWRKMDPAWQDHFKKYDGILEWMSSNYAEDVADWKQAGIDYYPHVHPGFSWANLKHLATGGTDQFVPRNGGLFYKGQIADAIQAGVDRLFVGMFDEYDEGTAIMPMSDDPPPTPSQPGTTVRYFSNPKMQEQGPTANKPQVEQTFDNNSPAKSILPANFLMRWEGQILPPKDGSYLLGITGVPGDTATLWIDSKQVLKINSFGTENDKEVPIEMKAGQRVVYRIDYFHATTPGKMHFDWHDASTTREEIPASVLIDAWGRFLTNEGHPSDWYLKLTSEAKALLDARQ